jgi:hypothetical protein
MSWRERKKEKKMPFIVATYVYASSQGQRTHSARTNVSIYHTVQLHNETIHKVGKVTEYEKRPDSLVYFDHCFHVFDIKVNSILCC